MSHSVQGHDALHGALEKFGVFGLSLGSSLHRTRADPVVATVLLQRSGLGDADGRNSLKPLKGKIWGGAQCYRRISVPVTARFYLPLVQPKGLTVAAAALQW